jgi:hypothetical protein
VTLFGLLLTPLFYVLVRKLSRKALVLPAAEEEPPHTPLLTTSTEVSA